MTDETTADASAATPEVIAIDDPRDQALLRIAPGATMNDTVLPSGLRTPPRDLVVDGMSLRTPTGPEARSKARRGARPY